MKHSSTWFALILIASALLLRAGQNVNAASIEPRPKPHQEKPNRNIQNAEPHQPESTVPLRNLDAAEAATLNALRALHAEQEARAKENRTDDEAFYANLISLGLLVVGAVYSLLAWKQWAAIKEQARISRASLAANRIALGVARANANAAKDQALAAQAQVTNLEKTLLATEKAAGAAVKNADAALAASAAYLDITTFWLETEKEGADVMDSGVGVVDPLLHWTLTNHGKSPAIVTEICWQKFFGLRLPDIPIYDNFSRLTRELVVGSEKEDKQSYQWSFLFGDYLTEDDMEPVRKMESRLQIYGYVRYRDIFDRHFIIGYAFRINAKGNPGLVSHEEAAIYVYRRFE
jgi:hypothetical protein